MFEGVFTAKTKKKNDERFTPGRKEGVLFGGNYADSGFLRIPAKFLLVKAPEKNGSKQELTAEEKLRKIVSELAYLQK